MIFYKSLPRFFVAFSFIFILLTGNILLAQPKKVADKKYTSILWEITGKGMQKPSYLFGTMHISNKMVFNLGDSFYHAIEHCDMVGLELDPGYWQEHFSKQQADAQGYGALAGMMGGFSEFGQNASLYKNIFSIDPYDKGIEYALATEPTMINSLLYRKNEENQEHEEDTYLDLYLYQICNKLSKKIVGLEQIDSSERMLREAQMALREDKTQRSYDREDYASPFQIQDAYKNGDLDLIDSLDKKSTPNKKYRAIFLDHRNEIQANSIDSVLKLHHTIFAGVGCAHLPGENGVIEVLRKMGYKMRPVKMNVRNGNEKDRIDRIRFPVKFTTQYTSDSVIKVDIPGTWFRFSNRGNVLQYADLANGSYYMLNRVATDALFQGQNTTDVLAKVDSLLYENIPGKIISKTSITKNGYKGFDITNRTRRGDVQRFQILITPFEVIVAKMSASTDYVTAGTEANTFFNSLAVRSLEQDKAVHFTPAWGGFTVDLPHYPYIKTRQSGTAVTPSEFSATDKQKNISYLIMKETVSRSTYVEEDTFELNLLNESYMSSKVFDKLLYKKFMTQNGYPALEASYQLKDSNYAMVRFVIQGGQYYAIVAQQKKPFDTAPAVLTSFAIKPFIYQSSTLQRDTAFGYSFISPQKIPTITDQGAVNDYLKVMAKEQPQAFELFKRIKVVSLKNDSTGENIKLLGIKMPPYTYIKDSTVFNPWQNTLGVMGGSSAGDTSYIFRKRTKTKLNNWDIYESVVSDTNSSRQLHNKVFYRQGVVFSLSQYSDTLTPESNFSKDVFASFQPADSLQGPNVFEPKNRLFFNEYASADSVTHARALANLSGVAFQKDDVTKIATCLTALKWGEPNYLGIKKRFIQALGKIEDASATSLLKRMYGQANDTALYQQQILASLIDQQTSYSFKVFEELVTNNPPVDVNTVLGDQQDGIKDMGNVMASLSSRTRGRYRSTDDEDESSAANDWSNITDSMALAKQILPGILTLMNLDDYKEKVQSIAFEMADSGYVSAQEMQPFYTKYLLEAKHEYKKAVAQESTDDMKKKAASIAKAKSGSGEDDDVVTENIYRYKGAGDNANNYDNLYEKIVMLTPFYATQQAVKDLVQQSFSLQSKAYRYNLFKMMVRKNIAAYPDTLPVFFAKDVTMREKFYTYLSKKNKLNLFPADYATPIKLTEAKLNSLGNSKPDTFALVGTRPFKLQQDSGTVYFYKIKWKKTDQWKWAMIGMVPAKKAGEWQLNYDDLDRTTKQKLDDTKTLDEQMNTLLRETLSGKRISARTFYKDGNNYGDDDMMGLVQRMRR